SAYAGGPGAWTRYFGPADPPLFPFLLGSQGLYGSVRDYARFLSLWQGDGIAGGQHLLSERAVRAALRPAQRRTTPTGFAGLESAYGEMMALWVDPAAVEERRVVAFGHGGSDGTAAWLFPAHDLTVLYFTQSRNTRTVIELEGELQRLVLDPLEGRAVRPARSYTAEELGPFTGEYWEEDEQDFRVVLLQEGRLWLEYPGRTRIELAPTSVADAFAYTLAPDLRLEFVRDDRGAIVAFDHRRNGQVERLPRLVPAADLPDVAALLARVRATLGAQHLAALGPLRVTGRFEMPALRLDGRYQALADGIRRLKSEIDYGSATEWAVLDGGQGWRQVPGAAREQLDAEQVHELLADHPLLVAADWQALYAHVRVLARGAHAGRPAYLVRAEPRAGCAHDWIVDAESSLPVALRTFSGVAGLGLLGAVTELSDWREVGGVRLPFRRAGRFSNRVLGAFETRWESAEAGVTLPEAAFEPPADAPEEAQEPRQAR
ncbi:MAG TPA: serine hydrolase, partial [Planctomycetota bacterium]